MTQSTHNTRHDTRQLPHGGFHFAPGVIDHSPRRPRRRALRWLAAWAELLIMLAVVLAIGVASGFFHAKGWL